MFGYHCHDKCIGFLISSVIQIQIHFGNFHRDLDYMKVYKEYCKNETLAKVKCFKKYYLYTLYG